VVNVAAVNVLAELGTATWTVPQAIAYETAQEGVRQAIGYFAQLIAAEESTDEPDAAAIAGWRADQQAWAARGQELTPSDTRAIKRIRTDADDLLSVPDDDDEDDDENESDEDDVDEADDADERDDEDDFDEVGDVGEADGDGEVLGRA
jgi:hypothetical protein